MKRVEDEIDEAISDNDMSKLESCIEEVINLGLFDALKRKISFKND